MVLMWCCECVAGSSSLLCSAAKLRWWRKLGCQTYRVLDDRCHKIDVGSAWHSRWIIRPSGNRFLLPEFVFFLSDYCVIVLLMLISTKTNLNAVKFCYKSINMNIDVFMELLCYIQLDWCGRNCCWCRPFPNVCLFDLVFWAGSVVNMMWILERVIKNNTHSHFHSHF